MNQIPIHTVGRLVGDPERMHRRDGTAFVVSSRCCRLGHHDFWT